jgi:hypothetical protein
MESTAPAPHSRDHHCHPDQSADGLCRCAGSPPHGQLTLDSAPERERGSEGIAIDGKAQRGRRQFDRGGSVVQVLTAFCQEHSVILAEVPRAQADDTHEAEPTVAPGLINQLDWRGRVLTAHALYCQRTRRLPHGQSVHTCRVSHL